MNILCVICGKPMAGAILINPHNAAQIGSIFMIHCIDRHWDLVERIHATSGDGAARMALNRELIGELYPS